MKNEIGNAERVLLLRGRITPNHPLFEKFVDLPPRVIFRELIALAHDAMRTQAQIDNLIATEHPLKNSLQGMTCSQALFFLVGATHGPAFTRHVNDQILKLSAQDKDSCHSTSEVRKHEQMKLNDTEPASRRAFKLLRERMTEKQQRIGRHDEV